MNMWSTHNFLLFPHPENPGEGIYGAVCMMLAEVLSDPSVSSLLYHFVCPHMTVFEYAEEEDTDSTCFLKAGPIQLYFP